MEQTGTGGLLVQPQAHEPRSCAAFGAPSVPSYTHHSVKAWPPPADGGPDEPNGAVGRLDFGVNVS